MLQAVCFSLLLTQVHSFLKCIPRISIVDSLAPDELLFDLSEGSWVDRRYFHECTGTVYIYHSSRGHSLEHHSGSSVRTGTRMNAPDTQAIFLGIFDFCPISMRLVFSSFCFCSRNDLEKPSISRYSVCSSGQVDLWIYRRLPVL